MQNICKFSNAQMNMNLLTDKEPSEQIENSFSYPNTVYQKPSVLIFANDKDVCLLLKTALEIWKYDVSEAKTIEQAFLAAGERRPDVVLMDMELVFSHSLLEMKNLQNCTFLKEIPFILLSGHAQNDIRQKALDAGAVEFFVKPINLEFLEQTLRIYIEEQSYIKTAENSF